MKSKRYANVNKDRCVACGACTNECPREAINVVQGCFANVDKEMCVGCGKCAAICPASSIELVTREIENA